MEQFYQKQKIIITVTNLIPHIVNVNEENVICIHAN